MHSQNEQLKIGEVCRCAVAERKELIKDASRDLDFGVQILKGYDGSNCPMNEVNEGVIAARSSDDQNSKNEDLYFERMGFLEYIKKKYLMAQSKKPQTILEIIRMKKA